MDEYTFKPIGFLQSPFTFKNGTPRQASVCRQARGIITIDKAVFNNPEHSVQGLEDFTHIWIFFVFHKNNNSYTKAKVKPPRLNGAKVGLFSTRSPYRPNNIGLTLAKIESVKGASITVSGIDILDGTPVIDLKPYIAQYDHPSFLPGSDPKVQLSENSSNTNDGVETCLKEFGRESPDAIDLEENEFSEEGTHVVNNFQETEAKSKKSNILDVEDISHCTDDVHHTDPMHTQKQSNSIDSLNVHMNASSNICEDLNIDKASGCILDNQPSSQMVNDEHDSVHVNEGCIGSQMTNMADNSATKQSEQLDRGDKTSAAAYWINSPPISALQVRFTERALDQLKLFTATSRDVRYRLKFMKTTDEVKDAILNILHEDPRSVYRRTKCVDSLYYFTVDVVHVTCWFDNHEGDDSQNTAEVIRFKPACEVEKCKNSFIK